jgi:hypothetical protein
MIVRIILCCALLAITKLSALDYVCLEASEFERFYLSTLYPGTYQAQPRHMLFRLKKPDNHCSIQNLPLFINTPKAPDGYKLFTLSEILNFLKRRHDNGEDIIRKAYKNDVLHSISPLLIIENIDFAFIRKFTLESNDAVIKIVIIKFVDDHVFLLQCIVFKKVDNKQILIDKENFIYKSLAEVHAFLANLNTHSVSFASTNKLFKKINAIKKKACRWYLQLSLLTQWISLQPLIKNIEKNVRSEKGFLEVGITYYDITMDTPQKERAHDIIIDHNFFKSSAQPSEPYRLSQKHKIAIQSYLEQHQ